MGFWINFPLTDQATKGTYRLHFTRNVDLIPEMVLPLSVKIENKSVTLSKLLIDKDKRTATVEIILLENPIPIIAIVFGILIVLGIGLAYLSLDKVEKLVDSPTISVFIIAVAILILVIAIRSLKK